jgi:hypothetical protein
MDATVEHEPRRPDTGYPPTDTPAEPAGLARSARWHAAGARRAREDRFVLGVLGRPGAGLRRLEQGRKSVSGEVERTGHRVALATIGPAPGS